MEAENNRTFKTPIYTRMAIEKYFNKMKEENNGERYTKRLQYLRDHFNTRQQLIKQQYRNKHPLNEIIIKTIRNLFK